VKLLFDTTLGSQTKILTDAQNAANLALLNAVGIAHAAAQQGLRHADLAASNQYQEQETVAAISEDDLAKITQAVTAALSAVLANMATGRPPVNQSGTTGTPVAKP
jgi:Flp pilus assembly protein TadG